MSLIKIDCEDCNSDGKVIIRKAEFPLYPNQYGTCPNCLGTKRKSVERKVAEQELEWLEEELSELNKKRDKLVIDLATQF